eukprot:1159988-Pelagomonas_calceolata.AAC.3
MKQEQKGLWGFWRVAGSTSHQNLDARSVLVFNCASSNNKLKPLGVLHRMCVEAVLRGLLYWSSLRCRACCVSHDARKMGRKNKKWF